MVAYAIASRRRGWRKQKHVLMTYFDLLIRALKTQFVSVYFYFRIDWASKLSMLLLWEMSPLLISQLIRLISTLFWPGEGLPPPFVCAILNATLIPIFNRVSCAEMCRKPYFLHVHAPRTEYHRSARAFRCIPLRVLRAYREVGDLIDRIHNTSV